MCTQGSSTRKTLVCASSEDSRESVRSLESAHSYYSKRCSGNDEIMDLYVMRFHHLSHMLSQYI